MPEEGWEAGDIAGAVSVVVPTELSFANMNASIVNNVLFFVLLMACMAVVFYVVLSRLRHEPAHEPAGIARPGGRRLAHVSGRQGDARSSLARDPRELYASREVDDLFEQFDSMARRLAGLYANLGVPGAPSAPAGSARPELSELDRERRRVEEINAQLARDNRYESGFPGYRAAASCAPR